MIFMIEFLFGFSSTLSKLSATLRHEYPQLLSDHRNRAKNTNPSSNDLSGSTNKNKQNQGNAKSRSRASLDKSVFTLLQSGFVVSLKGDTQILPLEKEKLELSSFARLPDHSVRPWLASKSVCTARQRGRLSLSIISHWGGKSPFYTHIYTAMY